MLLTVPCYPFPCFLICLKTVLPLKRRVSGLCLCWRRVPAVPPSAPSCHSLRPLHATARCPLSPLRLFRVLPPPAWVLLPSCSVVVLVNCGTWVCCMWLSPRAHGCSVGVTSWRCPCCSRRVCNSWSVSSPSISFVSFSFVLLWTYQNLLSCFKNKFVSVIRVKDW